MRTETVIQLETMIDHLTGEELGLALDFLNAMPETLDAIWIPAIGKKNRPCGLLQTLCIPQFEEKVVAAIFRHTHSLGLRRLAIERYVLDRQIAMVEKNGKAINAKIYDIDGETFIRPENDFIKRAVAESGSGAPAFRILKKQPK